MLILCTYKWSKIYIKKKAMFSHNNLLLPWYRENEGHRYRYLLSSWHQLHLLSSPCPFPNTGVRQVAENLPFYRGGWEQRAKSQFPEQFKRYQEKSIVQGFAPLRTRTQKIEKETLRCCARPVSQGFYGYSARRSTALPINQKFTRKNTRWRSFFFISNFILQSISRKKDKPLWTW